MHASHPTAARYQVKQRSTARAMMPKARSLLYETSPNLFRSQIGSLKRVPKHVSEHRVEISMSRAIFPNEVSWTSFFITFCVFSQKVFNIFQVWLQIQKAREKSFEAVDLIFLRSEWKVVQFWIEARFCSNPLWVLGSDEAPFPTFLLKLGLRAGWHFENVFGTRNWSFVIDLIKFHANFFKIEEGDPIKRRKTVAVGCEEGPPKWTSKK